MNNPYSLVFGIEPDEYVSRISQKQEVVNAFIEGTQRLYMVTGVRGSGKTVFMSDIKNVFKGRKDWVVIELTTERDMLTGLAGKLSSDEKLGAAFKSAKLNLSLFGIGVEIKNVAPIADIEVALQRMLSILKKQGKKLLVAVDEVVDNDKMREFASVFQILLRDEIPINLIMTGLYENIDDLQNERNLTFLHRAPKLILNPLNIGSMSESYRKNLKVSENEAIKMAQLTRGYSYAFQVLGYCAWERKESYDAIIPEVKQYLEEFVYDKIWSELSNKDRKVLKAIADNPSGKIADIRKQLGMEPNEFSPYKKRLVRKGLIMEETGYAKLTLPLFDRFVIENYFEEVG